MTRAVLAVESGWLAMEPNGESGLVVYNNNRRVLACWDGLEFAYFDETGDVIMLEARPLDPAPTPFDFNRQQCDPYRRPYLPWGGLAADPPLFGGTTAAGQQYHCNNVFCNDPRCKNAHSTWKKPSAPEWHQAGDRETEWVRLREPAADRASKRGLTRPGGPMFQTNLGDKAEGHWAAGNKETVKKTGFAVHQHDRNPEPELGFRAAHNPRATWKQLQKQKQREGKQLLEEYLRRHPKFSRRAVLDRHAAIQAWNARHGRYRDYTFGAWKELQQQQ